MMTHTRHCLNIKLICGVVVRSMTPHMPSKNILMKFTRVTLRWINSSSVQSILHQLFNKYSIYLYLIVVLNIITEFHLRVATTSQFLIPNVMVYTINLAGRKIICEFMNFEN